MPAAHGSASHVLRAGGDGIRCVCESEGESVCGCTSE